MKSCPVPQCGRELKGRGAVLCSEHYFAISPNEARLLLRRKANLEREIDPDARAHLRDQLEASVRQAVRKIHPPIGGQSAE